jgi:hypothetical protein
MEIFDAALYFFGYLLDRPAPHPCARSDWDALTRAAGRIFDRSADLGGAGEEEQAAALRRMARDCERCYGLLRRIEVGTLSRGALRRLDRLAAAIDARAGEVAHPAEAEAEVGVEAGAI